MSVASGGRHGLAFIKETISGITPDAPQLKDLRHTGCTLGISRDSISSNELRSDRQVSAVRTMADKIQGAINIELSYGSFDELLAAALAGDWTDNKLKVGTVEQSLSMERRFADIGQYGLFSGCYCNKLSLSFKPNALVTGSFDIIGLSAKYAATSVCASPTAAPDTLPFDSFNGAILEGGQPIAVVTGVDFSLENGIIPQFVLMKRNSAFVTFGKATCTGTLTAFFTDAVMLNKFLSESQSSLSITLGDGIDESYEFNLPRIVYTGADNPASDDGPVTLSMPFSAILDPTLGTNLQITRINV